MPCMPHRRKAPDKTVPAAGQMPCMRNRGTGGNPFAKGFSPLPPAPLPPPSRNSLQNRLKLPGHPAPRNQYQPNSESGPDMAGVQGIWSGITESGVAGAGIVCSGIAGSGVAPALPVQALPRRCLPETDRLNGPACLFECIRLVRVATRPEHGRPSGDCPSKMARQQAVRPRYARGISAVCPRSSNVWPRSAQRLAAICPAAARPEMSARRSSGRLSVIRLSGPGRQAGGSRPAGDCRNIHQKGWRPLPAAAPHSPAGSVLHHAGLPRAFTSSPAARHDTCNRPSAQRNACAEEHPRHDVCEKITRGMTPEA